MDGKPNTQPDEQEQERIQRQQERKNLEQEQSQERILKVQEQQNLEKQQKQEREVTMNGGKSW
jgi:hypothetical protein